MRLLLVYQDARLASSRVRVLQMVPHLEALGARCDVVRYPDSFADKRALRRRAADSDVVILQRKLPAALDTLLWRTMPRPVVFDFDDAIMFRDRPVGGSYVSGTRRRRFAGIVRLSSAFICGNDYLASFVSDRGKPVLVAASPVPDAVPRRSHEAMPPARIGWIGSHGNLRWLIELAPALQALGRVHDFVLTVIADAAPTIESVHVEHVPWALETQEASLAKLDIGIMPLADSPWARGKCAYKLLQYMAAEVAPVASPVGMNATLIRHGANGLLASTTEEWVAALSQLLGDAALRARLGRAGRETVESEYTYPAVSRRWMELLAEVAGSSRA